MKHIATTSKVINRDIVKMLSAAVAVGVMFSAIAAGIAMLLAHSSTAYAADIKAPPANSLWVAQHNLWVLKNDIDVNTKASTINMTNDIDDDMNVASPGNIYLSDGCGSVPIVAIERDWQVSIHGDIADIQVMQTFVIPITDSATPSIEESGYFSVTLPREAIYTSFRLQRPPIICSANMQARKIGIAKTRMKFTRSKRAAWYVCMRADLPMGLRTYLRTQSIT
ncbi:MAG: hypothetical protein HC782_00440 [Gammaproteobacteria bacterium]|nr:hypothetical protein [Gammaproteobacteria bacterium]